MSKTDRTIRLVKEDDQKSWDARAAHPLQSWAWGEFRKRMGIDVVRLWRLHPELVEGQLTFHKIPHTPYAIGYFPKGPAPTKQMVDELIKLGKQKKAIFIQLEPNVLSSFKFQVSSFKFLTPSHHPLFTKYTFVLDLDKSEDELLAAMHSKTRYNIRVAQKHGVIIKEDNSDAALAQYLRLTQETTNRQAFYAHNENYHRTMWRTMRQANIAHLFTATYQEKTLAAWIVFVWKDTVYYPYGASSRLHREVMAPTLLLWEIARWAKKKGIKYFDLWGALGPPSADGPNPHDPWYGFHRFKEGFNPKLVEFIGSYDLVINKPLYALYKLADTVRWFLLKLRK